MLKKTKDKGKPKVMDLIRSYIKKGRIGSQEKCKKPDDKKDRERRRAWRIIRKGGGEGGGGEA